ncbi:hypothetical protein ACQ4PT_033861 [Festuca glaucescens]
MAATRWFLVFAGALAAALSCCALTARAAGMPTLSSASASSSLDCSTVTSLLAGCAAFVRHGPGAAPLPGPGTPCCDGVTIVAGFRIGGAFHDPGSIDLDRGSGTRVDRRNSSLGRDPVHAFSVPILVPLKYDKTIKNKA